MENSKWKVTYMMSKSKAQICTYHSDSETTTLISLCHVLRGEI